MNKTRKITASLMGGLLLFAVWATSGLSKDPIKRGPEPARNKSTTQTKVRQISSEEKLVRDVYARLMRYQSAAQDELAAKAKQASSPDDYLTIELRDIRSGAVEAISGRPLSELVSPSGGAFLVVSPNHVNGNGVPHAYYEAQWAQTLAVQKTEDPLIGETLRRRGAQTANRYTSYEVTIRFQGQTRTYHALALYQLEQRPARVTIWDNIISEMNTVLKDESPRMQSPWDKYVKTNWYRAVVSEITATRQSGKPLIPDDAPIGYLPGDYISATNGDYRVLADADPCQPPCAIPNNFRQTGANDAGSGTLHFDYAWGSSSGNLADLANCEVGEQVTYNAAELPFASPPFPAGINPPNPTVINVAGNNGGFADNHSTPGAFVRPYAAATVTASQIYRFHCPCHQSNAWVTLMGPHNIVRSVSQNANGSWRFTITKTGSSATINPLP